MLVLHLDNLKELVKQLLQDLIQLNLMQMHSKQKEQLMLVQHMVNLKLLLQLQQLLLQLEMVKDLM